MDAKNGISDVWSEMKNLSDLIESTVLLRVASCVVVAGLAAGCSQQSPPLDVISTTDGTDLTSFRGERPSPTMAPSTSPDSSRSIDRPGKGSPSTLPERSEFVVRPDRQWGLQETVVDSLSRIGQPAVPGLVRMLRHPDAERRVQAADILARIGPQAEEAVAGLIDALEDPDERVRKAVARALGQIGAGAAEAVGPLLQVLEETSSP